MRTEYKGSNNGEKLRMCSVTGVCNEGKMSPGGREMATSGGERDEHRAGLLTLLINLRWQILSHYGKGVTAV